MASTYGYITVANLEAKTGLDYSVIDATYTDGVIEGIITQAERWVNEFCGQTFTGTIPDGVVAATLELSEYLMLVSIKSRGHEFEPAPLNNVLAFCTSVLQKQKVSIPYTSSSTRYHLPDLEG